MAGSPPVLAANDDQSQMLRRAMQAATAAEDAREADAPEDVQTFEPVPVDETDDSAAAQAAVFAPAKPMPAAANDAVTHDAVGEPAFEAAVAQPIELAAWVEIEIDERAVAEADLPLRELGASAAEVSAEAMPAPVSEPEAFDAPLEAVADDIEALAIEAEAIVEMAAVEPPPEDVAEAATEDAARESVVEATHEDAVEMPVEEIASDEPAALADEAAPLAADDVAEKKPRKKRAPAKRKAAVKPRKAKAADASVVEPVPEDDVWVSDAVAWSLSGEWADGAQLPPESSDCPRRLEELREAAAEGRLTIWGRTGDAGTWQPIEPSYWKSGTVEPASLAEGGENVVAEPKGKGKAKAARKYSALKVSRAQVEELWQPDAMH